MKIVNFQKMAANFSKIIIKQVKPILALFWGMCLWYFIASLKIAQVFLLIESSKGYTAWNKAFYFVSSRHAEKKLARGREARIATK